MADCPYCGLDTDPIVEVTTSGVHYAKVLCGNCRRFLRWMGKPEDDETKYRRPQSHRQMVRKFSNGYCELCRWPEQNLPKNCTLEAHHIIPYDEGGKPTRENTWILCTACHRLVEWQRTYRGQLLKQITDGLNRWTN